MAEFMTSNIRNIALMGHGSEGKTTLMESMLFAAGMTDRQGKVEDGTTVSDFDPEEKKRRAAVYSDGLVANGGPSTDVFKKSFGDEKTKEFFDKVLFGVRG